MNKLPIVLLTVLLFSGSIVAQFPSDVVNEVRKIKLLESTRDNVKQILYQYEASDDGRYSQTFSNGDVNIEIEYSSGSCTEDPDEDGDADAWKLNEWIVTRIQIDWDEPVSLEAVGIGLSKLKKEQVYRDDPDRNLYHDKAKGIAVEVSEDVVDRIIFFPPSNKSKNLCKNATALRKFYSGESWFTRKLEDRSGETHCTVASVTDLQLSSTELLATSGRTVSVDTIATDPENDVLTYGYTVSGGQIIGKGPHVTWDFTGVAPGTYSITAAVDDGCGFCGRTITKTVNLH